jgi:phage gpG-like protein
MIFDQHLKAIQAALPKIVKELAVESRNFFDESFSNKGFTDTSLTPWKPVRDKSGNIKQRPLVESGALRRSIRTEINGLSATIYTEIPYAQIHNEGGPRKFTASVRSHTRKGRTVKTHNRTVDTVMPQRQFMGSSAKLEQIHVDIISNHLNRILNAS